MALLGHHFLPWGPFVGLLAVLLLYLVPYVWTYRSLRSVPGPFLARFTNLQNMYKSRTSTRTMWIYNNHRKYGNVVRLAPNHVSIAHEEAVSLVLGHGNGFLKSSFYDAFVTTDRSIFTTRSRAAHARKRRIVSHTFSPKHVHNMEPRAIENIAFFIKRLEKVAEQSAGPDGFAQIDCVRWFMFLTLDTMGDLVFGTRLGLLEAGSDIVETRASPNAEPVFLPAIQALKARSTVSLTLGALPELIPYARYLPDPFIRRGLTGVKNVTGIAIARVAERLKDPEKDGYQDILATLLTGKGENGEHFEFKELIAEAATVFIAGTETTGITLGAIMIHLAQAPRALKKLQEELDAAIPDHVVVPSYDQVRSLPYLDAVINESQRHHATVGVGLPREIPHDSPGLHFQGHYFPPGTVLSVPGFTVHHLEEIWGPDAMEYKPERWENLTSRQRTAFIPFSHGPTACVGRPVAELELKITVASWVRRFDIHMRQEEEVMFSEGLTKRPVSAMVGIRRRQLVDL